MVEPWFNPNTYAWIPGTAFGCLGGLYGALVGTLAPMGKGRSLVQISAWALSVAAWIFLALGVTALIVGQPYGVWYGLLLPGVLGIVLFSFQHPLIRRLYENAELRKMQADDIA